MVRVVMDLVAAELDRLHERIAPRFGRSEPRARVREYVSGLVAGLERKNGWTLAEQAGETGPDGMRRLLHRADWDVGGVRDDVRGYVVEHLGDPAGVLVVDETSALPVSMKRAEATMSWYQLACDYVDAKWPRSAATTRRTVAEAQPPA